MKKKSTSGDDGAFTAEEYGQLGLSKREYFAILALQGILTDPDSNDSSPRDAVRFADKLIEALNMSKEDLRLK